MHPARRADRAGVTCGADIPVCHTRRQTAMSAPRLLPTIFDTPFPARYDYNEGSDRTGCAVRGAAPALGGVTGCFRASSVRLAVGWMICIARWLAFAGFAQRPPAPTGPVLINH